MKLEISLAPEALFHIGSFPVTNSFLMMLAVSLFIGISAVVIGRSLRPVPRATQNIVEMVFLSAWDFIKSIVGDDRKAKKVFPLIFSLFVFILISNLVNFIPGQAAVTVREGAKLEKELARGRAVKKWRNIKAY